MDNTSLTCATKTSGVTTVVAPVNAPTLGWLANWGGPQKGSLQGVSKGLRDHLA